MGVSTLHASNIKGKTFKFAHPSHPASCVLCGFGLKLGMGNSFAIKHKNRCSPGRFGSAINWLLVHGNELVSCKYCTAQKEHNTTRSRKPELTCLQQHSGDLGVPLYHSPHTLYCSVCVLLCLCVYGCSVWGLQCVWVYTGWVYRPALSNTVVTSVCPSIAAHISGVMSLISRKSITARRVIYVRQQTSRRRR